MGVKRGCSKQLQRNLFPMYVFYPTCDLLLVDHAIAKLHKIKCLGETEHIWKK